MSKLEHIAKTRGMRDYREETGKTYMLSKAEEKDGVYRVPVIMNGSFIGYARMEKQNDRLQ